MKLLDKYLIKELAGPFFFAILGFLVFMISHILFLLTDVIVNKNIPFGVIARMMLLRMPAIMVLTFPVAILFGTVLSISGMVASNEITALRSIGISFPRIMVPFLVVGILLSVITFVTNEKVVPWASHRSENIIRSMILKQQVPLIQSNVFQKGPNNQTFYVQLVDEEHKRLQNIMIFDLNEGDFPKVITAKEATWDDKCWYLTNGTIHKFDKEGRLLWQANFNDFKLQVDIDVKEFFAGQKTPQEMTTEELKKQIDRMVASGQNTREFEVDYQIKFSLPLASLITALVGAPLSVKAPRSGKMMGIAYSFGVIFVYYNLMSIGRAFARNGIVPPEVGAWCPVIVVGTIGILLLFNVEYSFDKKSLLFLLTILKEKINKIKKFIRNKITGRFIKESSPSLHKDNELRISDYTELSINHFKNEEAFCIESSKNQNN
ncbi:MAG TPA: LptF/LptG family permease [Candidatus Eremiobacteraeota bacterium]|nr:MAG: putative permease YjgP/YjgQ family protein [bacterium ADurb.Bin363]HPZ09639.1 LptF/LptG family permease [Candidatus Eremiobacteraeota bacterium]